MSGRINALSGSAVLVIVFTLWGSAGQTAQAQSWKTSASAGVKETWDDNVFIQDEGNRASRESFITNTSVNLGATRTTKGSWDTTLTLGLTPQYTWYHSESSENHFTIGGLANFAAKTKGWSLDLNNAITHIDGDDHGLIFTGPGGAPAAGGIPIRDRRDADIYRTNYRVTWTQGDWMIRPVITGYVHDFHTRHLATTGYQNYVDRNEFVGGVDVGYKVIENTYVILGYRYGEQKQAELLGVPLEYSNTFHRVLVGVEGKPTDWLKVAVLAGPDFRDFGSKTAAGFDDEQTRWFIDGVVTVTLSPNDEIGFSAKRYTQPGFGGRSVYDDTTYLLTYKRKITQKLTAQVSGQAYNTDFFSPAPVMRDDWIYTINVAAGYKFTENLSGEIGWSHDLAESQVPNTEGREFNRNLAWVSVKWMF